MLPTVEKVEMAESPLEVSLWDGLRPMKMGEPSGLATSENEG